jgi:phage terminase large subunit
MVKTQKVKLLNYVAQAYKSLIYDIVYKKTYKEYVIRGGRAKGETTHSALAGVTMVHKGQGSGIVIRQVHKTHRATTRKAIINAIHELKLEKYFKWSEKDNGVMTIHHKNGCYIAFEGFDDPGKLRGYEDKKSNIAWVWFEECQNIKGIKQIDDALATFDRYDNIVFIFGYNPPISKRHWCNTELTQSHPDRYIIHLSYLDILEVLKEGTIKRAEKLKLVNFERFQNEYMGLIGTYSEGKVFNNLRDISKEEILKVKANATFTNRGLDLGFSNKGDPTSYTGWVKKRNSNGGIDIYCVFEHHEKKMKIPQLAAVIKTHNPFNNIVYSDHMPVVVDSLVETYDLEVANAYKSNREMRYYWLANEVDNIFICEELTPNTYKSFEGCEYKTNKNDELDFSVYPKEEDHPIDSCLYAFTEELQAEYSYIQEDEED